MDLNLSYRGGSGGFFGLHLILLAGSHKCKFSGDNTNFTEIFHKQWNIIDQLKWKKQETWPDNEATMASDFPNKIYFLCNPDVTTLASYPGKRLVIYTDIDTQFNLALSKGAYWFYNRNFHSHRLEYFLNRYRDVKGMEWPDIQSIDEFYTLPTVIQKECLDVFAFQEILDIQSFKELFKLNLSKVFNNERIDSQLDPAEADHFIKLQDIIKTKGEALYSPLGLTRSSKSDKFIDDYLDLHTPDQRALLLK